MFVFTASLKCKSSSKMRKTFTAVLSVTVLLFLDKGTQ